MKYHSLSIIAAAVLLASCASAPRNTGGGIIDHAGEQWPLLAAKIAAQKQSARMHSWMLEAERLHLWEPGEMLPIPPVPDFGFAPDDKPADFLTANAIPAPPVTEKSKVSESSVRQARMQSLYDCALSWGVRSGMNTQLAHIQQVLKREDVAKMMDQAFDFGPVMLTRYLTPPVVTESRDELMHHAADKMSLLKARYRVISQARFTSVKPNWRGFMHQVYAIDNERQSCDANAFALTAVEKSWWSNAETAAKRQGVQAANMVFANALERLTAQHNGMMKYHEWVWRGLLDVPHVSQSDLMLNLDATRQDARLNEKLLRLVHLPRFSDSRSTWNTSAPHTEEREAAAVDLALPVCSGQGCTNDHFAIGGLRHSSSEDYFIHPTLMLRGGGGHASASQIAEKQAAKQSLNRKGSILQPIRPTTHPVSQAPGTIQVTPLAPRAETTPVAIQVPPKKTPPAARAEAASKPAAVPIQKTEAAPAKLVKPAPEIPSDSTATPDKAPAPAVGPAAKPSAPVAAQPLPVIPSKQTQEQTDAALKQDAAVAKKTPKWRNQPKYPTPVSDRNADVRPEAKRMAQEILKARDAEYAKKAAQQTTPKRKKLRSWQNKQSVTPSSNTNEVK